MKLNGGFTATVTGVLLAAGLGGTTYMSRQISATAERIAVVETKLDAMEKQVSSMERAMGRKWESIHASLAELLRLASPEAKKYEKNR